MHTFESGFTLSNAQINPDIKIKQVKRAEDVRVWLNAQTNESISSPQKPTANSER